MPHLRSEVAKRLARQGLRQGRIAEHLGVSQAMVSKYRRATIRPPEGLSPPTLEQLIGRAVQTVLDQETKGRLPEWCPLCLTARDRETRTAELEECMRADRLPRRDENQAVLENLNIAARQLQGPGFAVLAPQVNVNLAMAVPQARDSRGVAAFPGRIVEAKGELVALAPPEFGVSQHLSLLLLRVRKTFPKARAIMCIKDSEPTRRALRAAGFQHRLLRRIRGELNITLRPGEQPDAIIDPGAFGIEPITYLLGETAIEVVDKADRIRKHLPP